MRNLRDTPELYTLLSMTPMNSVSSYYPAVGGMDVLRLPSSEDSGSGCQFTLNSDLKKSVEIH